MKFFLFLLLSMVVVANSFGATIITKTIKASGGDYTSLSGFEAAEQADLVSADQIMQAECYSFTDTTNVVFIGWTTDSSRYIRIYTPLSERHKGVWNTGKYIHASNRTGASTGAFEINEEYVRVEGLQLDNTHSVTSDSTAINIDALGSGNDVRVSNCIIKHSGTTTGNQRALRVGDAQANTKIWNCIIYDANSRGIGINASSSVTIYNCTIYNCDKGLDSDTGTCVATNCAIWNSGTADFEGTITKTNCASDAGTGTNPVSPANWNTVFRDIANRDLRLKKTDTELIGAGTDAPGGGLFSDDIESQPRSSTWDISADEYIRYRIPSIN